jgi:hypothetical protein
MMCLSKRQEQARLYRSSSPWPPWEHYQSVSVSASSGSLNLLSGSNHNVARRVQNVRDWSRLPLVCWCECDFPETCTLDSQHSVVIIIYVDSIIFVAGVAVISNGFGIDSSHKICSQAVVLCLSCYMTTKVGSVLPSSELIT